MGYNPTISKEATNLSGYRGDKREQKAHIIIPRAQVGAASNDVGFEKTNKGFVLHASEYDRAWRTGGKIKTLNKSYSENKLRKYVSNTAKCHIASHRENEKGQIEIQLRIM